MLHSVPQSNNMNNSNSMNNLNNNNNNENMYTSIAEAELGTGVLESSTKFQKNTLFDVKIT